MSQNKLYAKRARIVPICAFVHSLSDSLGMMWTHSVCVRNIHYVMVYTPTRVCANRAGMIMWVCAPFDRWSTHLVEDNLQVTIVRCMSYQFVRVRICESNVCACAREHVRTCMCVRACVRACVRCSLYVYMYVCRHAREHVIYNSPRVPIATAPISKDVPATAWKKIHVRFLPILFINHRFDTYNNI
jgi:hypothetical protein